MSSRSDLPEVAKAFLQPAEREHFTKLMAAKRINMRHLHWLKRSATTGKTQWRPTKRYRTGARKWIEAKDNMIRVCTVHNGMQAFVPDNSERWSDDAWHGWPHLNLSQDQGSDGFSAVAALKYKPSIRANVTEWWDESHGLRWSKLMWTFRGMLWGRGGLAKAIVLKAAADPLRAHFLDDFCCWE